MAVNTKKIRNLGQFHWHTCFRRQQAQAVNKLFTSPSSPRLRFWQRERSEQKLPVQEEYFNGQKNLYRLACGREKKVGRTVHRISRVGNLSFASSDMRDFTATNCPS
jgi:hypothetical protein